MISKGKKQERIVFDALQDGSKFYIACKTSKPIFKSFYLKVPLSTTEKKRGMFILTLEV